MTMHTPEDRGSAEPKRRKPRDKPLFIVVTGHERFHNTNPRAASQQHLTHIGPLLVIGDHERRPMLVEPVFAIDVRTRSQQQIEHVVPRSFDRDVQRLRPPAPVRMRANGIHDRRRCRECGLDGVDMTCAYVTQKSSHFLVGWRR